MKKSCTCAAAIIVLFVFTPCARAQNVSTCLALPVQACSVVNPEGSFNSQNGFQSTGLQYSETYRDFRDTRTIGLTNIASTLSSPAYTQVNNYSHSVSGSFRLAYGSRITLNYIRLDILNAENGAVIASCTETGSIQTLGNGNRICFSVKDQDILPQLLIRYRFVINYNRSFSGAATEAILSMDDFGTGETPATISPLPVLFTDFYATVKTGANELTWKVATETNVQKYEVERSTDQNRWTRIGSVPATGSSVYSFTDRSPVAAVAYYRIRNTDADGRYSYSTIIAVKNQQGPGKLTVAGSGSDLVLHHPESSSNAGIILTTMEGKLVQQVRPVTGSTQTVLAQNALAPGMYLISFRNGRELLTVKFVKP